MKAVIVAGGRGERLRPFTDHIPKPMIEVRGKPMLLHIIELLKSNGIVEIILALRYLPEVITSYFGNGSKFGVRINYTFEDANSPLGTAGAILSVRKLIDDTFIVTYGDILRDLDIKKMINFHNKNKAFATINVYRRESRDAKSKIYIDDKKRVTKFIERPKENDLRKGHIWVNGSFYILEPEIFNWIPAGRSSDFGRDIFPELLISNKALYAFPTTRYFIDIGDLKKLEVARQTFQ